MDVTQEEAVSLAIENNAQGIAYTYNEPTIFMEYALDVAKIAHRTGTQRFCHERLHDDGGGREHERAN